MKKFLSSLFVSMTALVSLIACTTPNSVDVKGTLPTGYEFNADKKAIFKVEADGKTLYKLLDCSSTCGEKDIQEAIRLQGVRETDRKLEELRKELKASPSPNPSTSPSPNPSSSPSPHASTSPSPSPSAGDVGTVREPAILPVVTGGEIPTTIVNNYSVQLFNKADGSSLKAKADNEQLTVRMELGSKLEYTTRIFRNGVETTYGSTSNNKEVFDFNLPTSQAVKGDVWDIRIYWKGGSDSERMRKIRYTVEVK